MDVHGENDPDPRICPSHLAFAFTRMRGSRAPSKMKKRPLRSRKPARTKNVHHIDGDGPGVLGGRHSRSTGWACCGAGCCRPVRGAGCCSYMPVRGACCCRPVPCGGTSDNSCRSKSGLWSSPDAGSKTYLAARAARAAGGCWFAAGTVALWTRGTWGSWKPRGGHAWGGLLEA